MAVVLWEMVLKDRYAHVPLFIDFIRVSIVSIEQVHICVVFIV